LCERTYRRHYTRALGFEGVNQLLIEQHGSTTGAQIGVIDCTFGEKSGRHTPGLDWFYNGKTQQTEKGLEWSVIGVVDLDQHTGYSLSAQQTEAGLAARAKAAQESGKLVGNRVDFYLGHLAYCRSYLPERVKYLVGDLFYSKLKWIQGLRVLNLHAVGKLRQDANVNYLYNGPQTSGPGRKKKYAGKVDWNKPDVRRFKLRETRADGTKLYSLVVWSVAFKCNINLVYLLKIKAGQQSYILLFSTDLELSAQDIHRFYSARFQIEFIFRDARQFTGLNDSQARNSEALDTQVNASLTALNLAKAALRPAHLRDKPIPFSLASLKRRAHNEHLLERFISNFDLDPSLIKSNPNWSNLLQYGTMAA
jgi:hypothetical protein